MPADPPHSPRGSALPRVSPRASIALALGLAVFLAAWDTRSATHLPAWIFIGLAGLVSAGILVRRDLAPGPPAGELGPPRPPRILALLREGLALGFVGFGGGLAVLAQIEQRFVLRRGWIRERQFLEAAAIAQMLPGAVAANALAFIGLRLRGAAGAVAAIAGFILPSFLMMLAFALGYATLGRVDSLQGVLLGFRAAATALVFSVAVRTGGQIVLGPEARPAGWRAVARNPWTLLVAAGTLVAVAGFGFGVPEVVGIAGLLALLRERAVPSLPPVALLPRWLRWRVRRASRRRRGPRDLASFGPFLALLPAAQGIGLLGPLAAVFLRAGAITFGGGFVMIPLLEMELVHARGWLTPQAFSDAMALGQITPGPVVITSTFVGAHLAGLAGALVATLAVFLPSFLVVLAVGTSLEAFRGNRALQAFLHGLQPAVVGLLFAAGVTLARQGLHEPIAWTLAAVSFVVLARGWIAPAWVLLGAGAVGALGHLAGF